MKDNKPNWQEELKTFGEIYHISGENPDTGKSIFIRINRELEAFIQSTINSERENLGKEIIEALEPYDDAKWLNAPKREQILAIIRAKIK